MIAPTTATLEDAVAKLVAAGSGVDYNSVLSGNKVLLCRTVYSRRWC